MEKLDSIKDYAKNLNLSYLNMNANKIIEKADLGGISYQDLLLSILDEYFVGFEPLIRYMLSHMYACLC